MTTANQLFKAGQSSKSPAGRHLFLSEFLGNISLAWKMILMAAVLFLGTLGVAAAGYTGLQAMRYQFSNIYDFMLIPINGIDGANTSLEEVQHYLTLAINSNITAQQRTTDLAQVQADNQAVEKVINTYDTQWVTTTSPQFTQDLKNSGKLGLQQEELADLAAYHTAYNAYKVSFTQYLATVQAGSPDTNLANTAINQIQDAQGKLQALINVNLQYADFSNTSAQAALQQAFVTGLIVLISGLALGIFLSYLIVVSITSRLTILTTSAAALQAGNLDQIVDVEGRDEVSVLGTAFNSMAAQLKNLFGTLEQRVLERTQSLELAAEVGRSVSQVRALDVMLKDAAEIIRSQFDLYYVQVYLTNPSQTALILQSGTGTVGAELLERAHQLPLNMGSINGRSAIEKRSVVISDTTASATFLPNPLLPDTHSEMAVPLLIGERVVGVLDLQSKNSGSLNQDILPAFEALAGQLAIAIQNASLLSQAEQARAEVEAQARRLSRANWIDYLDAIHQPEEVGFVFEQNHITPMTQKESAPKENALVAPISVTGEPLGSLVVEMDVENQSTQNVELINIVARQVAQQIENLRLLESAERYRFEAEESSRRLTHEGWKDYTDTRAAKGLSYLYDLTEVRPDDGGQPMDASTVDLPLKVRDETIGRLVVQGLESGDSESLELANMVAERLGAHIESLRQQDQTQSALAQSEKLFDASRRLTQAADLQELVKATIETLNILAINRAVLATLAYNAAGELESGTVVANWWNGTGTEAEPVGQHYTVDNVQAMSMFLSPTPMFIDDVFNDERIDPASKQIARSQNTRTVAALPLFLGMHQVGTLLLEGEEPHNFVQEEIRLYTALAPQIATILESRRQFQRAQKQAERETMLNTISQKIQSATTVEAVLQIAARELGHALGAPLTIAQLGVKDHGN